MEVQDFRTEVVDRSFEVPIVVDFWAPWCGPCRALGPVIEAMAGEANGLWELKKVNTDENQEIAQALNIQSIPAVKMIYQGKIIGEFVGALPKPQIAKWLAEHLPEISGEGEEEAIQDSEKLPALDEVIKEIVQVPDPEFIMYLDEYLNQNPDDVKAKVYKATHIVFSDPAEAEELTNSIKEGDPLYDQVHDIRTLAHFYITEFDDSKVGKLLSESRDHLDHGRQDRSMQLIIDSMHIDKTYKDEIARKTGIALFHIFGKNHPISKSMRKYFDMAIY